MKCSNEWRAKLPTQSKATEIILKSFSFKKLNMKNLPEISYGIHEYTLAFPILSLNVLGYFIENK